MIEHRMMREIIARALQRCPNDSASGFSVVEALVDLLCTQIRSYARILGESVSVYPQFVDEVCPHHFFEFMTAIISKVRSLLIFGVFIGVSSSALALSIPEPKTYDKRLDPNTDGGERVGEDEDFTGYPKDPNEVDGQLYQDASEEYVKYSKAWTGASWGFGLQGGASMMNGPVFDKLKVGGIYGGFVQITTLLNVVDLMITATHENVGTSISNVPVNVAHTDLSLSATIHPMFFAMFSRQWFAITISQFYMMGGGNLGIQSTQGDGIDSRFVRPGFHMGAGIDTYLTNPSKGRSLWLGLQYRWTNTSGGIHDDLFRYNWTREHQIFLRLSMRFNGNIGNSVPGPSAP